MQRVALVDRCGTPFDVVHVAVFVGDDERSLELTHVLGVDAKIGLKGNFYVDALGDVDERPARPHGRVESRKFIVT